ncbi:MAG: hypothetical protein D6813_01335 [Calditrichaeota bacterium]|nr:MAG: hypothetical protein D6813_01335 [Calditrichota bacterium]
MSDTQRTLIITGFLILTLITAWYAFIYRPKMIEIKSIKLETENLLNKLRSFRVSQRQIVTLEKKLEQLEKEIQSTQSRIPTKTEFPQALQQIKILGGRYGLKFLNILPEYDSLIAMPTNPDDSEMIQITVHIQLQGRYKNYGQFLEALKDLPFYVSLGDMILSYKKEYFPELEIMLDIILYLRRESSNQGKT